MRKILSPAQEKIITHYENTYKNVVLLKPKDRAILDNQADFPQINEPRLNKELEKKAVQAFDELDFLLSHLPKSYRFKILSNEKSKKFFKNVLDINSIDLTNLDDKNRGLIMHVAAQLFYDSITVLITVMPLQFKGLLKDSLWSFAKLLIAIRNYDQANSLKRIPEIKVPDLLFANEPEYSG